MRSHLRTGDASAAVAEARSSCNATPPTDRQALLDCCTASIAYSEVVALGDTQCKTNKRFAALRLTVELPEIARAPVKKGNRGFSVCAQLLSVFLFANRQPDRTRSHICTIQFPTKCLARGVSCESAVSPRTIPSRNTLARQSILADLRSYFATDRICLKSDLDARTRLCDRLNLELSRSTDTAAPHLLAVNGTPMRHLADTRHAIATAEPR